MILTAFLYQQIRQSDITLKMNNKALGALTDDLKQALEEAQVKREQQLKQFHINQLQDQTQELKQAIEENRKKGVNEVVERLQPQFDMIMAKLNQL